MDREYLKEKLTTFRTLIALFWTGLFILGGGLIRIFYNLNSSANKIIFSSGLAFEMLLFVMNLILFYEMKRILKKIKGARNV